MSNEVNTVTLSKGVYDSMRSAKNFLKSGG